MNNENRALSIYFAGDLFDAKDLGGNLLLAQSIEKESCGRYKIMLPQDGECEVSCRTSQSIRDTDFEMLLKSDLLVANFDGCDLDSGTVVEFCFAKMVDMPALLLRTDFRNSGDHTLPDGEPWNLMCSHYPRTAVRHINGMQLYHKCKSSGVDDMPARYYAEIAREVIAVLDDLVKQPAWLAAGDVASQYHRAVASIGGSLAQKLDKEVIQHLAASKISAGLY